MEEPRQVPKLGFGRKAAYAFGAVASSIETRGAANFLLIFYNQVVGLEPALVSSVIFIATLFDVLIDPTVGHVSDHFQSHWGRRHPFLYASVIPFTLSYFLLWCPPHSSQSVIFAYMLGTVLLLHVFGTVFELPSAALLPELTQDYHERTSIIALRQMFGLIGGIVMTVLAYQVFLKEMPGGHGGVLSRQGYFAYGFAGACVIAASILISALGTHKRIPYLAKPQRATRPSLKAMGRELYATLNNPSFVALLVTGALLSIGNGIRIALDLYFQLYFWALKQSQMSLLLLAAAGGTLCALGLAPWLGRRFGKRYGAMIAVAGGILGSVVPVLLRLIGVMPNNGTPLLFGILFVDSLFTYMLATSTIVLLTSMLNDVVEDIEVKTGRRSEGLLLAADNLLRKLVSGMGVSLSGVLLTLIAFPRHAVQGAVGPEVMAKLAYAYIPITFCYVAAAAAVMLYRIDRTRHEANVASLRNRALGEPLPETADPKTNVDLRPAVKPRLAGEA